MPATPIRFNVPPVKTHSQALGLAAEPLPESKNLNFGNLGEENPGNTDVDTPEEETDEPMPAEESPCNTESSSNAENDSPRLEGHSEESDGNTEEDSSVMGNAAGHWSS